MRGAALAVFLLTAAAARAGSPDVHVEVAPGTKVDIFTSPLKYPTIQSAIDHAPQPGPQGRLYIHIAPGIYAQRIYVSRLRPRTTFIGMGSDPSQVVITGAENAKMAGGTFFTETAEILGDNFEADNVTFENTAGNTGQALAITVASDRAVFKHCRFLGYQDTLFADYGRQYYVDSTISGAVDFIFGNASAVFDHSEIHIVHAGYLTAQSRTAPDQGSGYVIIHSRVTADDLGGKSFTLGRPWRRYSRVVFLDTELPASLDPKGWSAWGNQDPQTTFYGERGNTGPGAAIGGRVSWSHQLTADQAASFAPSVFLAGDDKWDAAAEAARLP
jgi:pectinesterase